MIDSYVDSSEEEEYYPLDEFLCYTGLIFYEELSENTKKKIDRFTRYELITRMYIIGNMRKLIDPKKSIKYELLSDKIKNQIQDFSDDPQIHKTLCVCEINSLIPPGGFTKISLLEEKLNNYGKKIKLNDQYLLYRVNTKLDNSYIESSNYKSKIVSQNSSKMEIFFKQKLVKAKNLGNLIKAYL